MDSSQLKKHDLDEIKRELRETQRAIKEIKDYFERSLAEKLNLMRVSAPLFVRPETGFNDNLSGREKAVKFQLVQYGQEVEIVQSLAKWKRIALKWYGFNLGQGIYTDMDAIRPHEVLDPTHSFYVDQWDWEKVIGKEDRTEAYLEKIVRDIYSVFLDTEAYLDRLYPGKYRRKLPEDIKIISSQELEDAYKDKDPEEREYLISKKYKAVFISKIGAPLKSGEVHSLRAPDYDDWELNGDIIFWDPVREEALELSSMGIRVDEKTLDSQLNQAGANDRRELDYHKLLLNKKLPYTVGGGIGQSRMCMYFLEKEHIGEVQASVWTEDIIDYCDENGIMLL